MTFRYRVPRSGPAWASAFFFEQDVIQDIKKGTLVRLLEDWTPPFAGLCLYYPGKRHPSAGLSAFLSLAREMAKRD
jgi:DNA-binding transcriptional LysR family regulator